MKRPLQLTLLAASLLAAPAAFAAPGAPGRRVVRVHPVRQPIPVVDGFTPSRATRGGQVVVFGRSFPYGTQVLLNGRLIIPSRVTADRISFTIPAGAMSGALALRTPGVHGEIWVGRLEVSAPPWRPEVVIGTARGRPEYLVRYDRELRWTREARRARDLATIRARFDWRFLSRADVQTELRLHAERTAGLDRMLVIARTQGFPAVVARIERARSIENARHEARMDALRASTFSFAYRGA